VVERTRELEATNRVLRQTQLAVMQTERLRALGQMASGIAHASITPCRRRPSILIRYWSGALE